MKNTVAISVVVPVFGCTDCLPQLCERIGQTVAKFTESYEIILVNDDSPDDAWSVIRYLARNDDRIKGICLSKNFGQHRAITAGLDYARGQWSVVMDCDLQDRPEEIARLYDKAMEGYDVVFARRAIRCDRYLKRLGSRIFHLAYGYLTDKKSDPGIANFGIYSLKVIQTFRSMREQNRTFPLFVKWMGFKTTQIDVQHGPRNHGQSGYTLSKLVNLAIEGIVAQSNKPLRLAIKLGFIMSSFTILYAIYRIIRYMIWGVSVTGWTSLIVSIYFLSGLLLANMGILGLYIGKVFDETKQRPLYVISRTLGLDEGSFQSRTCCINQGTATPDA